MSNADTLRRVFSLMDEKDDRSIRQLLAPGFSAVMAGGPPITFGSAFMPSAGPDGSRHTHAPFMVEAFAA